MNKTKKALLAALACSAALAGAFGLAACTPGESGGESGHNHTWGNWTVATTPDSTTQGKATRTCSGKGECDAKATDKEATLPVLSPTDYTITNDTATCQAAGTATYTYNKNGVSVSFTAATPVNPEKHTDTCGHGSSATHSHVWSEWTVETAPTLYVIGLATRECTGSGECDAEAELSTCDLPPIHNDDYDYAEPVHKTDATCKVQGAETYTYTNAEKEISVSFDVYTGYGEQVFENNECTVCHKTVTPLTLDTEVTVEATAEESLYSFTATAAGKYEIVYTEGSGANVVIDGNIITTLPYATTLDAGEKVSLSLSTPEGVESETYKFKVVPVTILEPDYGTEENPVDPYEVPTKATVTVGGGKTARVDVSGRGYGIVSYTGNTPIVVTYTEYDWIAGEISHEYTLAGTTAPDVQESFVLEFGFPVGLTQLTVSSAYGEEFEAEISLLLAEEDPDTKNVITVDEEKSFENVNYFGQIYKLVIEEDGNYTFTAGGDDAEYVAIDVGTDEEVYDILEANEDGSYTLEAGTYYILISSTKPDPENEQDYLNVSGTVTVSGGVKSVTAGEPFTVSGTDGINAKKYTIELEAGDYKITVDDNTLTVFYDILIGSGYDNDGFLAVLEAKDYNGGIVNVETAGTYYLEVYADMTFTITKLS
ncbi:MAG: hypothetical protein K2K04_02915 [Clostridia bacterium]|nr:hypothetical protein [Clostridia bacterium]